MKRHRTPFRQSEAQYDYYCFIEDEFSDPSMYRCHLKETQCKDEQFKPVAVPALADGIALWGKCDYLVLLQNVAERLD